MLVSIIVWIIIGGLAGWVASMIMKTDASQGLVADIIVGIIGAFIGGFVLSAIGFEGAQMGNFNIASFVTALVGAVILLGLMKVIRRN